MSRLNLLLLVFVLIQGCATSGEKLVAPAGLSDALKTEQLVRAEVGDEIDIRGSSYAVVNSYVAASGRSCKKLVEVNGGSERVACTKQNAGADTDQNGQWYIRNPILAVEAISESVKYKSSIAMTPAAKISHQIESIRSPEASMPESRIAKLQSNETLWRFSKRVTGSALYWEQIARFNGVDDVKGLSAGTELKIPSDLPLLPHGK